MPAATFGAPLDPRLVNAPAPFGADLVDEILAGHGPRLPGGAACKGCGFTYHGGALDCPSVIYALSRHRGIGKRVPLRGES